LFRARRHDSEFLLKTGANTGPGLFELDSNRPRDRVPLRIVRYAVCYRFHLCTSATIRVLNLRRAGYPSALANGSFTLEV
jgi:hypothetical protein